MFFVINAFFRICKANLNVAESSIEEGNGELKAIIAKGKDLNVTEVIAAQAKIDMGLCRKHKIVEELDALTAKKKKLIV